MFLDKLQANVSEQYPLLLANCRVFLDFDNTMTISDVLSDLILDHSIDKDWIELEDLWRRGRIGARECLRGQLKKVRIGKKDFDQFLSEVKLDEGIFELLSFLDQKGIKPVVLSDNFLPVVDRILDHHGIRDIKIYANGLRSFGDRLIPSFPYYNPQCPSCAHCKKTHVVSDRADEGPVIYIGDGRSDFCPANASDLVFAKDTLAEYLEQKESDFLRYENLKEVADYFKNWMYFI